MKAKNGFVMRCVVDEYILMPTGDNINYFNGNVILNEVSAFIWEKLQQDTSRDNLLAELLNEYDVELSVAEVELDKMLNRFYDYGLIE